MGADVSSEQPPRYTNGSSGPAQSYRYASNDLKELAQKYRERFGEDIPDSVVEKYKIEMLKADQRRRQADANKDGTNRTKDENTVRKKEDYNNSSRDNDDYHTRKKQEQNLRIMQQTYDRTKREPDSRRKHHSDRSRDHKDSDHSRSRRHHSPRDRSRSRKSSSDSSTKENRSKHHSSQKSHAPINKEESSQRQSHSTVDRKKNTQNERHSATSKHRDRSSSRKSSLDSSTKENRRKHHSSKKSLSPESRDDKSSRHSRSSEGKSRKKTSSNHRTEKQTSGQRTSDKRRERSHSEDEKRPSKKKSSKEYAKRSKKDKSSQDDSVVVKLRSKKKKSTKASRYQSAPDLTENDRQYGKGPWERTHNYFDEYGQQPQSWVRELSQERSAIPTPYMERQIIYGIPSQSVPAVDGLGYPLKERSPGFQAVPYQTYLVNKPSRPRSMDLAYLPVHGSASLGPMSSPLSSVQPNTMINMPVGAVPAIGPMASSPTSAQALASSQVQPVIIDSNTIIPQRGYQVQAHLPTNMSSTLPSKFRHGSNRNAHLPNYKTPPQYGNSVAERSDAPTPKPRTKSPTKSKAFDVTNTSRSSEHKKKKTKITAVSAREELEGMLSMDYDMSNVKGHGEFSEEFPPVFPGNYRANQAIFVDDVIFRKHPKIPDPDSDTDSSGMVTDEEHVLTLGAQMSPNSPSYSSGFDLEIPEGFCFDSEGRETSPEARKKTSHKTRDSKAVKSTPKQRISETHKIKKSSAVDFHSSAKPDQQRIDRKSNKDTLVLTAIEPKARNTKKSTSSDLKSPKQKARSKNEKEKNSEERIIYPSKVTAQHAMKTDPMSKGKKMKNKKIQHPAKDEDYQKIIIPSKNWVPGNKKKNMHNVGVGTKQTHKQKTVGVQTPKPKEAKAQPIYFLKPISSQEVFIEDSSIASRSETDMSQEKTVTSSNASNGSTTARSGLSWSRSSNYSTNTDPSEIESVRQNFKQKSRLHSNNHIEEQQVAPSIASTDFESEQYVGPASMTLGVSESIQASSYTGRGGKVFCITKSKQGSSQASINSERRAKAIAQLSQNSQDNPHVAPEQPMMQRHMNEVSQSRPSESEQYHEGTQDFSPHQVGKWVLDCYAQDHKLTTQREQIQSEDASIGTEPLHESTSPKIMVNGGLVKQKAVDMTPSFENYSQEPPVVTPLTTEALSWHEKNATTLWPKNTIEDASTDHSVDLTTPDIDVFQRELIKARQKIHEIQRSKTPEPTLDKEQYKNRLKQWNDSPTANVVLAECCEVTDDDLEYSPRLEEENYIPRKDSTGFSQNLIDDGSDTESFDSKTTSSATSEEYTDPRVQLRKSLEHQTPVGHIQMQDNRKTNTQNIDDFIENLGKNPKNGNNQSKISANSQNNQNDDWRRVGSPRHTQPTPTMQPIINMNSRVTQQDPIVPRSELQQNPIMTENKLNTPHLEPLRLRTSSLATESDNTSCSSPIANPFNKMDNDEIESLVGKIPGKGSRDNTDLEKDVMAELEKSRTSTKRESLEERTARILGIHRKTSSDSDNSETPNPPPSNHKTETKKKDMNSYMNDLLTGAADVSPVSRQRYYASDLGKKNMKPQVTSPLVTTQNRNKNMPETEQQTPEVSSNDSTSEDSDDETVTESYSVNVSDSVMEANIECSVRIDQKNRMQSPTEYKIPDNVANGGNTAMSPSKDMMLSYGANIYAETPGFHKREESSDSSASDEPQVYPLENKSSTKNQVSKTALPQRVLQSPVPVAVNSPPLTDGEIDILKELVKNSSRTTSQASFDGMSSNGDYTKVENQSIHHDQSQPGSSRNLARQKIAESIGFTLDAPKSGSANQQHSFNSDEYDIKILSADRNKNSTENKTENPTQADKKEVQDAIQSLGLNPDDVCLFNV